MSFCSNCGKELSDGMHFCSHCGYEQQSGSPAVRQRRNTNAKRMHCPECKSTDISPIVETEISGGTSLNHSFSKRNSFSAMQFNNTHRNYWMCSNCGTKFRNIQNLEEEIAKNQGLIKRGIIGIILCSIIAVLYICMMGFGLFTCLWIFVIALTVAAIYILRSRNIQLNKERTYLKKHCFD